eukprot:2297847-Prymnesium_polylepis.1
MVRFAEQAWGGLDGGSEPRRAHCCRARPHTARRAGRCNRASSACHGSPAHTRTHCVIIAGTHPDVRLGRCRPEWI